MRYLSKLLCAFLLFICSQNIAKAQTTLAAGDIAITGYISNDPSLPDQFSFVLLSNVTANTVLKFTDFGWRTDLNAFSSGTNLESEITLTLSSALNAGTEITISGTTATVAGGGSAGTMVYTTGASFLVGNLNFSSSGDQMFIYQNTFASPTFITGLHMNVYTTAGGDPTTTDAANWDGVIGAALISGNNSGKPAALITGTNAIWIGTSGNAASERDNGRFNCGPDVSTAALARAAINNQTNWTTSSTTAGFTLPTGCNYLGILSAPVIGTNPSSTSICAGAGATFTASATGATGYQWQVSVGGGPFNNLGDDVNYSGTSTTTLTLTNVPNSFNGNQYRMVATNGSGSANSTAATLTVTPLPGNPTLAAKVPATGAVADGTNVSATFNAGSGGTGCTDDYRYTTNGGVSYLPYTPGSNISTTGLAAGTGYVFIEGRRANCSSSCQGAYVVLASWYVTPLPAAATALNAGDIAFSGYTSTSAGEDFSFVLLRNIGSGTTVNFTDNGWLSTNVLQSAENTVTWTSNAAYPAGTEIVISGTTATLAAGGSAGTVTGVALNLSTSGDQILAYRGTAASPTFITAIHMNVYSTANGDAVTTTAAAWDGTANTQNSSALPTGLTTGVNAIWIGTQGVPASEFDNSRYGNCAGPGTLGPITGLRAALNNQANWISDNSIPPGFTLPTGCSYLGSGLVPNISVDPTSTSVCEGANASFTATVSGATGLQWQVDNGGGGGFVNITNDAVYSGATTATLNINAAPLSLNGYQYRLVATNGTGSSTSASATLTVTALPVAPTLNAKTPAAASVADGTNVSATFNAGSGGTGCTDDFRYTVDGGATYLPYTPGSNISTTGLAAGSGFVFIEGRRASCSAGCQGSYKVLAQWYVTPLPVAATTLNAGDIAFSGYTSTSANDDFSFVLLRNIGPGTVINFTDNGWLSTNVLQSAEQTITWTSPGAMTAGTEIRISGLTATRSGGGAAGTVTGTALTLSTSGDQILAYRGTAGSPTFIGAIHMNVYIAANGDPVTTTAAAWDGTANTQNSSALPAGLTTGVNAIWIGTQGVTGSEFNNSRYGNCNAIGVSGPLTGLRAALNNQANWISDNNTPPSFTLPTGCNYLGMLCPTITVTNPANAAGTAGTPFSETFTATGGTAPHTFTTGSTLPTGLTLSAAGVLSGTPTQGGTFPIVVTATDAGGSCSGNGATYTLVIGCPANTATATPSSQTLCSDSTITTIVLSGGLAGTTYNWTRDNNAFVTGIAASGSGDISGVLTNTTSAPVTVTFTITPVIYGCNGTTTTATVIVNPTPDVVATPSSQSICTGGTITTIVLSGSVTGTQFNWTRDNAGVTGIATSGNGDISGALTNGTNAPITVTFTITPTANGCNGTPVTATVTVNPTPNATATPSSQSRCSGQAITPILMSGAVSGTTFAWVRDNVGTIGGTIPASGNGNISGNLVNNTGAPVTVTFTITPSANGCPGANITATVTVNPLPLATIIGGGAVVCENSNYQLRAATDPGYTYAWGRSLFTTPFTAMGLDSFQTLTASGNYLLTVTNQYGCVDTAMTTVNVADYVFNGSIAPGDAVQTGRLNRFAVISTCAAPKGCPGAFTTVGNRAYDSYTITNPRNVPVCATIGINSYCATNIFSVAYTGSYNPTSLCTNYLADPGSSFTTSGFYEATIPANGTIVVVVHEVNSNTGCSGYLLSVDIPRDTVFTITPNDTVCSGTPVTLTAPVANSYLWTPGGATTQSINPTPALGTTTYSVRLGYGNVSCTTNVARNIVVNSTPDVATVTDKYYCANATGGPIAFTGTVPGTTYNWTNNNTAIGLGASGTGNIPSFTATNNTGAPITGTITVTPSSGSCTGTPITFTITVAQEATITSVTNDTICAPGGVVTLFATGTGLINWYDSLTGGALVFTGNTYSPSVSATTTYYVESLTTAGPVTTLAMPAQSTTFPGNVRGYWFTAPANFVITSLSVPTTASSAAQSIAVVKFNGNVPPPVFSATTNAFTTVFLTRNNPAAGSIAANIPVQAGEVIGILGYRGNINSYAPGDYNTTIMGFPVQLQRLGMQFQLTNTNPRDIWREFGPATSISRVEFEYAPLACVSSPRVPVTAVVNPQPAAVATPASQTVCSGPITTIVLTSNIAGTTYAWTRDNTGTATGIAASGTGDISGTLTNTTTSPVTVTFTITPTSPDGCVGPDITATVTVQAIPTIICPANISVSNDAGLCSAVVTYSPTITGIPVPTVGYTFTGATTGSGSGDGSGSTFNVGITTVEIIATNVCGADTCSFTVTVNDTENPAITCPAPVFVSCSSAVPAVDITSVTAGDNCPGVVVTHISDVISGQTCANRYTLTRTYRATDASGNFVECTQIITVNDITPPVLTCPADVTVSCVADVPPVNVLAVTGVSDNCGGAVTVTHISDVITNQTCANRYQLTRTYRATDVCGNFTECTQVITVDDQTAPTLTCPAPVTVSCVADVPVPNIADVTGVSDNCAGVVTVTHEGDVISNQTCLNRYTITRTYRATDVCGNFTECTQIITVNDQTPPVITCPAPVTVSCAGSVPAANIALVTATDNCGGGVAVTHEGDVISNQTCANRYTITRTYRATDACGNFAECTQVITVDDQTPPTLTCPAPITVTCSADVPAANIALVTGVSDNCGGTVTVTHVSDVISNQTCANKYTLTRTYRATDACGNFTNCTQIITVDDATPPVLTCPGNITVSCAGDVPAPDITLVTAVSDNCAGTVTVTHVSDVIVNQTCANRYQINRTYRATDVCGNFAQCVQIINVNDVIAPTITCPAPVTVSCASAVPAPSPATVVAADNCGAVTVTHISDVISSQTCANRYIVTRTYRATDACGNFTNCTQIITVNDQTAPVITCPANINISTLVGSCTRVVSFNVTATDNCGGAVTIVNVPASGSVFAIGTTLVTSTATDACGNTSTCTFNVTVTDAQLPVITTQPTTQTVCIGTPATFSVVSTNTLGYQWQRKLGSNWFDIPSATLPNYIIPIPTLPMNNDSFRVVIRGLCTTIISNHVALRVNALPNVTLSASPLVALLPGQTTTITATATPAGGSFAWVFNGLPMTNGVTGPTLGPLTVDNIGAYRVVYTDLNGCRNSSIDIFIIGLPSVRLWIYPNPNDGRFQVRYFNTRNEPATLSIYDRLGQRVFKQKYTTGSTAYSRFDVDLRNQAAGIYVAELTNGAGVKLGSIRFVINR